MEDFGLNDGEIENSLEFSKETVSYDGSNDWSEITQKFKNEKICHNQCLVIGLFCYLRTSIFTSNQYLGNR